VRPGWCGRLEFRTTHRSARCSCRRRDTPLPWLHIAEVVAAHTVARRFRRVGLTGTRWLVDSEVYPEKLTAHGLDYVRPSAVEREEINRIIMDELVCDVFKPEAVAYFQMVIGRMKEEGCDAVVPRLHRDPVDHR
jgi:aspartate racemase